jgi:CheY-like chemotaxis protein
MTHVLIVEDDDWLRQSYERQLQASGYDTTGVGNALEAIDAMDNALPDVLVLDLWLPGPNGIALLNELQSHVDLSHIPVILCTAQAATIDAQSLAVYGVRDVVDKATLKPGDLVAAVQAVVSHE